MAHYEFFCHACSRVFSKNLTPREYEEGEVLCPRRSSDNVEERWAAFLAITATEKRVTTPASK